MVGQHLDDLTLEEPLLYAAQNLAVRIFPVQAHQRGALGVGEAQELNE